MPGDSALQEGLVSLSLPLVQSTFLRSIVFVSCVIVLLVGVAVGSWGGSCSLALGIRLSWGGVRWSFLSPAAVCGRGVSGKGGEGACRAPALGCVGAEDVVSTLQPAPLPRSTRGGLESEWGPDCASPGHRHPQNKPGALRKALEMGRRLQVTKYSPPQPRALESWRVKVALEP